MSDSVDKSNPNNPNNDRDGRLKLRKNNEEVLRKIMQADARKKCLGTSTAFGECAKEHGMMVVFKCRAENTAMQDCLKEHYNDELFLKFLADHGHPPARPTYTLADRVTGWFK